MFCKFLSMMASISITCPFDTVKNRWWRSTSKQRQSRTGLQNSATLPVFAGGLCPKEFYALAPPPTSHCGRWQECPDSEQEHHLMYNWAVVTVVTVASRAVFLLFICSPSPSPPHSRLGHGAHSFQLKMSSVCVLRSVSP